MIHKLMIEGISLGEREREGGRGVIGASVRARDIG